MKAVCNREGLLTAFQVASAVVPARSPKPILTHIKLDLRDEPTVTATDLELGIRYRLSGAEVEEPGQVVVPSQQANSILRELTDEKVLVDTIEGGVRIAGASSQFDLPEQDPMQFPEIPDFDLADCPRIKNSDFERMVQRTVIAAAPENSRYALASVLMDFETESLLKLVATDGKRLALMPGPTMGGSVQPSGQPLVAPKAMNLLLKVLHDPEEELHIHLRENDVLFRTSKMTLYSRLVEGRFPKYQDVFPEEANVKIPLVAGKLLGVVRQASIVLDKETRGVVFEFLDGELVLQSQNAARGQSVVKMPIGYDGEPVKVTFDPLLLMDALRALEPEQEVVLHIIDEKRAVVMRTTDGFEYIIMPLTREGKG